MEYKSEIAKLSDITIFSSAGIDTTAYTFSFLLMEVVRNRDIKARLQAELAQFMPADRAQFGVGASNAAADKDLLSAIAGAEYLNCCVKEVLRLWPVAAGGPGRDLIQDIEYNGMLLPKGSMVVVHLYSIFRERWIDSSLEFKPERWLESSNNPQLPRLKEMMMPFSLGRRACIGQNMALFQLKIVAAHLLHYFDFELVGEPTFEYFITLKPDQLKMRVSKRV